MREREHRAMPLAADATAAAELIRLVWFHLLFVDQLLCCFALGRAECLPIEVCRRLGIEK